MHIAFVSHDYPPLPHSGVGGATATLAEGLVQRGHQATVFVVDPMPHRHPDVPTREDSVFNGVNVMRLCIKPKKWMRWRPGMMWQRWQVRKTIQQQHRKTPFQILETADSWGWLPYGGLRGVPLLSRMQGTSFFYDHVRKQVSTDSLTHWFEKMSLAKSDRLLAVSNFVGREQMKLSKCPEKPTILSYNAVDTDFFSPAANQTFEEGLIVFVNFVETRKGIFQLAEAMNILAPRYPKARLAVAGKVNTLPDGRPISEDILKNVQPEYRNRIDFLGWHSKQQVLELLRRAHVCCYPSLLETFGIAAAEAMAVGKPVVYSNCGPGAELIEHGKSGLLCEPLVPADIAEKIGNVFDSASNAEAMGRCARERAVRLFSKKQWVEQNLQLYQSLCA